MSRTRIPSPAARFRRLAAGLFAGTALVVLVGCSAPEATSTQAAPPAAQVPSAVAPAAATAPLAASAPERLEVPSIGVAAGPLQKLGLTAAGALEVPGDATTVGWFGLGPTPGASGPAVLAAHVDYGGVPGTFTRLSAVAVGDEVRVARADGTTAVFTAYRVAQYPKSAFPTEEVYGDTPGAELRLITCGGAFDDTARSYADNVVVYARLTGTA
ncbi:class F sortase [Pseudonocardia kujensis]|uniref:class F sortase n=1 Tax=Pseudonocardia kujensis TaxID=1128675 RepID=UPI001E506722|nr:class F sortase [Pseudonocardia kujensis]MCE0767187.1 class F sortase [Pseudonocardia kujensis]